MNAILTLAFGLLLFCVLMGHALTNAAIPDNRPPEPQYKLAAVQAVRG